MFKQIIIPSIIFTLQNFYTCIHWWRNGMP